MTHVIYKGELTNKLLSCDPSPLVLLDDYCIYTESYNDYSTIMNYQIYLSIWGENLESVEPTDLPEEILFKFLALYGTLDDFYEAFEIAFNK